MHDLVEVMEKCKEIKELKQKLVDCFKAQIASCGLEGTDTQEAGAVVDMIKDLAETEKECMEALYYQKVTEAMLSYEEPRYGYNPSRSASTGRYVSRGGNRGGRGGRMGFMPHEPWTGEDAGEWDGDMYMEDAMMGYDGERGGSSGGNRGGNRGSSRGGSSGGQSMGYWPGREMMDHMDPRYGEEYNRYKMVRRHYTETKSPEDKREMSEHAEKHLRDTIDTVKDIWADADPDMKKKMKEDMTKLVNSMSM